MLGDLIFKNPSVETQKRISEILKMIRKGKTKLQILDHLTTKYDIIENHAYKYYHDALVLLRDANSNEDEAASIKAQQIERINAMLSYAIDAGDTKTALRCQDMLNKIYQLYVEKKEVDLAVTDLHFKFADDDE